ncbi:hypothetical protein [Streptomyces sp. NPDC093598]|uniref:hypothetical protein n=1 Tax=Streptomyces sp. NPDC093598 TaxID=3366046 RepID=UPI00380C23CF
MYSLEISESAERACRSVMHVCADWESVARAIDERDRVSSANISAEDHLSTPESSQCLSYLARMVTQAESFTFGRIRERVESHVKSTDSPMLSQLYEKNKNALDSTWENALNAFRDWCSIDLREAAGWPRMQTLIEVRNASAHGGGYFTERQKKNRQQFDKTRRVLQEIGYGVEGNQIVAARGAVRKEARSICAFIQEIDALTRV